MSEKDFAGKLAAGMRRARQSPTPDATAPADAVHGGASVKARCARQSDQSPPPSLDQPWRDLHPERIWPD
jgi:hypothetical protein